MFHFAAFGNNFIPSCSQSSFEAVWRSSESQTARHFALQLIVTHRTRTRLFAESFSLSQILSGFQLTAVHKKIIAKVLEISFWYKYALLAMSSLRPPFHYPSIIVNYLTPEILIGEGGGVELFTFIYFNTHKKEYWGFVQLFRHQEATDINVFLDPLKST